MTRYIIFLFFIVPVSAAAQNTFNVAPDPYNLLIVEMKNSDWAAQMERPYRFTPDTGAASFSIYNCLLYRKSKGCIKTYKANDLYHSQEDSMTFISKPVTKELYIPVSKDYDLQFEGIHRDPQERIFFNQLLYLKGDRLQAWIIAAAPVYEVTTSTGVFIGNTAASYNSVNKKPIPKFRRKDKIIPLGTTWETFNLDSLDQYYNINKTFGMNLGFRLWLNASKGAYSVTDLATGHSIKAADLLNYSITDTGIASALLSPALQPVRQLFTAITLRQQWFYNSSRDVFFCHITAADLYITYPVKGILRTEKRFRMGFDE